MRLVLGMAALALVAGCGGTEETPSAEPATTSEAPATREPICQTVPEGLVSGIMSGEESGAGLQGLEGAAWRSPDYEKVFFVAVRFTADGVDDQVGVWATSSLKAGGGLLMAVDPIAQEFTVWPDADSTRAEIGVADPGVEHAKECLS